MEDSSEPHDTALSMASGRPSAVEGSPPATLEERYQRLETSFQRLAGHVVESNVLLGLFGPRAGVNEGR